MLAGMEERYINFFLSLSLFLVLISVKLVQVRSHRYVMENVKKDLQIKMGNSLATVNHQLSKAESAKFSCKPPSCFISLSSSYSCKGMSFLTNAELYVAYFNPVRTLCEDLKKIKKNNTICNFSPRVLKCVPCTVQQC